MAKYEIEPFDWQYKLNQLSLELKSKKANVEVIGETFGNEYEGREMQLLKLYYDKQNDTIEIKFDQCNHLIESPLSVSFQQHQDILEEIEIVDDNNENNIIEFIEPFLVIN
jgi:hypothetical protein